MEFAESKGFLGSPGPESPERKRERRERIRSNQEELARRKKEGEIDTVDYERNYLYYLCQDGTPAGKRDLKIFAQHSNGQAINISQEDLLRIKKLTGNNLKVVLADGTVCEIDPEKIGYRKPDRLIIFPEELGDLPPSE